MNNFWGYGGHCSSGSLSPGGPSNHSFFLSLNIIVLTPRVIKSAGFIDVGQNLQVWDDVISCILRTRVRTNCCGCLLEDNQDKTICESLQYITSLLFTSSKVLFRNWNSFAPKSAANSSSRGSVVVFKGATLVLAIRNAVCIPSSADNPLK